METVINCIVGFVLGLVILAIFAVIGAIPLFFLWNWLMPVLFGIVEVTFGQAIGLLFLTGILFKSSTTVKKSD